VNFFDTQTPPPFTHLRLFTEAEREKAAKDHKGAEYSSGSSVMVHPEIEAKFFAPLDGVELEGDQLTPKVEFVAQNDNCPLFVISLA